MNSDKWGCKADYIQEMIECLEQERHEINECDPETCSYCKDERTESRKAG